VSTSVASSQTLVNTGNPTGTNVVTVNSTANAGNTFTLTNDGLIQLFVTIAGALVQALKSNETDPILQLGAATHLVEVLGDLTVDGNTILSGTATVNGNATLKGSTSLDNGHFTTDGAGLVNRLEKGILFNHPSYPANELGNIASGDVLSISAAAPRYDTHLKAGSASSGSRIYMEPDLSQVMYAASDGIHVNGANNALFFRNGNAFGAISSFTGSGTGTYNHGNDGTPFFIAPIVSVAGSATQGYDTLTATQCHITLGAALAFKAWTYR